MPKFEFTATKSCTVCHAPFSGNSNVSQENADTGAQKQADACARGHKKQD